MKLKLIFIDSFDSEFKGKNYTIYRFVDPTSLSIITGNNLAGKYEPYKLYECMIEFKNNKFKVTSVL